MEVFEVAYDSVESLVEANISDPVVSESEQVLVPIDSLRNGDSPRIRGVDESHARLMAESGTAFPAIYVQRGTMRIIDGMHRLLAARLRNETHILVKFFDDDDDAAYLRGVAANITHGRPLTLADRKAAAGRVIEMHPDWSDRAVAATAGLSDKTVAAQRRASKQVTPLDRRRGQDGRVRPVDAALGRQVASELLTNSPEASLRSVAKTAGVSPTTVRNVRDRMHRGDSPVPASRVRPRPDSPQATRPKIDEPSAGRCEELGPDCKAVLKTLSRDPSLRYAEAGRTLLRWLSAHPLSDDGEEFVASLPAHSIPVVAQLIAQYARQWDGLAKLAATRANRA
ncbi:ParB N-terminal domain-containing protein [Streptomyces sp. NPDC050287]|uniref:ParB N-terminal domain-containing protein n=1 Tax=Streptomyces sp. NPDC050287 TaxID=3365608 RepID=UPI003793CFD2